jgi:hypothetical protein
MSDPSLQIALEEEMAENGDFNDKVQNAILEEMSEAFNDVGAELDKIINTDPKENDSNFLRNRLISISQAFGYMTALFNQYYILSTGTIPKEHKIGFEAMHEDKTTEPEGRRR